MGKMWGEGGRGEGERGGFEGCGGLIMKLLVV